MEFAAEVIAQLSDKSLRSHILDRDPLRILQRVVRADSLTRENIHAAFTKYFPADRYTVITLVPEPAWVENRRFVETSWRERALARAGLGAILLVSVLVRLVLIRTGQDFWPDESFHLGFTQHLLDGDVPAALATINGRAHFLFSVVWIVPDAIRYVTGSDAVPGLFFGMLSVVNLGLLYRIARQCGAGETEATVATGLWAASATGFYYARHLVPYDLALLLGLLSVSDGLSARGATASIGSGALAAAAFLAYAGYWTLGVVALALHVRAATGFRGRVIRCVTFGLGGLAMLGVADLVLFGLGQSMIDGLLYYSGTITQGDPREAWRLPFEYLWHAEHGLFMLWLAGLLAAVWHWARGERSNLAGTACTALLLVYGAFVLFGNGFGLFVVYGRLVRQLVPFFCLLTAHELVRVRRSTLPFRHYVLAALAAAVVVQAGFDFRQPLTMTFPREFRNSAVRLVSRFSDDDFVFVNARHIFPAPIYPDLSRPHHVVAAAAHAQTFQPYLYEGYTPAERAVLRRSDLTMRLMVFDAPAAP